MKSPCFSRFIAILLLSISIIACSPREQVVIVVTATSPPATETKPPTNTPAPSHTPRPTNTPRPSWTPVAIGAIEEALRNDGYRRYPWTTGEGVQAFDWIKESAYEQVTTWEDGSFELQVLHDSSAKIRLEHMEDKFKILDKVLPQDFMIRLRQENDSYNRLVRSTLSGTPDERYAYGGEWQTVWAEYYTEHTTIGGYDVWFSVWWWQSTCPPTALFCYYDDFPGLEFIGDSSFSFYTIFVAPVEPPGPGSSSS